MYFVQGKYSKQGKKIKGVGKLDFSATATFSCFQDLLKFLLYNIKQSSFYKQATFIKKKLFVRSPYFVKFDVNITNIFVYYSGVYYSGVEFIKFGETEESETLKSKIGAWLRNFASREGGRKDRGISVDQE